MNTVFSSFYKLRSGDGKGNPSSVLSQPNGYSIAEILLVFGIIAGVLIGVWAMYTMLGDKTEVQKAVAEIQMLQQAAATFKSASETGNYASFPGFTPAPLKPYLGKSGLGGEANVFGGVVWLFNQVT